MMSICCVYASLISLSPQCREGTLESTMPVSCPVHSNVVNSASLQVGLLNTATLAHATQHIVVRQLGLHRHLPHRRHANRLSHLGAMAMAPAIPVPRRPDHHINIDRQ
jgi:hypothetical protein